MTVEWHRTIYNNIDASGWIGSAFWRGVASPNTNRFLWFSDNVPWVTAGYNKRWYLTQNTIGPRVIADSYLVRASSLGNDNNLILSVSPQTLTDQWYTHNGYRYWRFPWVGGGTSNQPHEFLFNSGGRWILATRPRTGWETWETLDNRILEQRYADPSTPDAIHTSVFNIPGAVQVFVQNATILTQVYTPEGVTVTWTKPTLSTGTVNFFITVRRYYGDDPWWEREVTGVTAIEGRYRARGFLRGVVLGAFNGPVRSITWALDGYVRQNPVAGQFNTPAPAGKYTKITRTAIVNEDGTISETITENPEDFIIVGHHRWDDQAGTAYRLNRNTTVYWTLSGDEALRTIYYRPQTAWVIGTPGSAGWFMGPEPSETGPPVTYIAMTWAGSNGVTYARTERIHTTDGQFRYNPSTGWQDVRYTEGRWVLGVYNASNGWYEGAEPRDGSVVFEARQRDGGNPPPLESITLTRNPSKILTYIGIDGVSTTETYTAEVGIWC